MYFNCSDCGVLKSDGRAPRCRSCTQRGRKAAERVPDRPRFYSHVSLPDDDGCRLWLLACDREGYGVFTLSDSGTQKQVRAHHAALMFEGIVIPPGMEVCHTCDVPSCVEVSHLWVGTHAANIADRDAKGHTARGVAAHKGHLTEQDVLAIRASRAGLAKLAKQFGIDPKHVWRIRTRKNWRHVA